MRRRWWQLAPKSFQAFLRHFIRKQRQPEPLVCIDLYRSSEMIPQACSAFIVLSRALPPKARQKHAFT